MLRRLAQLLSRQRGLGAGAVLAADPPPVIVPSPPGLVRPTIGGKLKPGGRLRLLMGNWRPDADDTIQWYAGKRALPKATGMSLRLTGKVLRLALGKQISVRVTFVEPGSAPIAQTARAGKLRRPTPRA